MIWGTHAMNAGSERDSMTDMQNVIAARCHTVSTPVSISTPVRHTSNPRISEERIMTGFLGHFSTSGAIKGVRKMVGSILMPAMMASHDALPEIW